ALHIRQGAAVPVRCALVRCLGGRSARHASPPAGRAESTAPVAAGGGAGGGCLALAAAVSARYDAALPRRGARRPGATVDRDRARATPAGRRRGDRPDLRRGGCWHDSRRTAGDLERAAAADGTGGLALPRRRPGALAAACRSAEPR